MTVYSFDSVVGQSIAFDAATDVLALTATDLAALNFSQSGDNVVVSKGGQSVTLTGTTLSELSSGNGNAGTASQANVILSGTEGFVAFGDDTREITADNNANTLTLSGETGDALVFGLGGADVINFGNTYSDDVRVFGGSGAGDSTDGGDAITIGEGNASVNAAAGNDTITFSTDGTSTANIFGGIGNDSIVSGVANDGTVIVYGGLGQDTININAAAGFDGDVTIYGGAVGDSNDGADVITGGTGETLIFAAAGNDAITLNSTDQNVTVGAGVGNDTVTGAASTVESLISLGTGNDTATFTSLAAGSEVTIYGAFAGGDTTDGADTINVASGAGTGVVVTASIEGHGGNDTISTVDANDTINATILGGQGDDSITGDADVGVSNISGGAGADTITGGAAADTLAGGVGEDSIVSGAGADSVDGGDDDDTITNAGGGADTINGGAGGDTITGGAAIDSIDGGEGADSISAAADADIVNGGAGNDTITGGAGADSITGGEGGDTYIFDQATGNDTITGSISDLTSDTFAFDSSVLGTLAGYAYTEQASGGDITADGTLVVLTTAYASVNAAAAAIAADATVTTTDGIFVFFDSTANVAKVVYTDDLGADGVEATLANLSGVTSVGDLDNFSSSDFAFVA